MLDLVRLTDHADVPAGELSHGQKQWLEIGMLLMQNPKLLLVDEPVAGMTHQEMDRTAELLLSLAGEHTDALLREIGRDADAIAQLRADGIVSSEPNP